MIRVLFGLFLVLHGFVHLLYVGQSARVFELQAGMTWPENAWTISWIPGGGNIRIFANILLAIAAIGFILGGVGVFAQQAWWRSIVIGSAIFSTILYLLLWNGTFKNLDNQGLVGILINIAILAAVLVLRWPNFTLVGAP